MIKVCNKCGKQFKTFPCRKSKYCSCACAASATLNSPFVKGHKDFVPRKARKQQAKKMRQYREEKSWNFKKIGFSKAALHDWIEKHKGKASSYKCKCGEKARDWSSRNHRYERNLEEFRALCRKCHMAYDIKMGFRQVS